jgi:hypothetical protein
MKDITTHSDVPYDDIIAQSGSEVIHKDWRKGFEFECPKVLELIWTSSSRFPGPPPVTACLRKLQWKRSSLGEGRGTENGQILTVYL